MAITFHNADLKFALKQKKELKQFLTDMIKAAGFKRAELSFVFCSDDYLLDINRRFLNHDYYTDIITFPLGEEAESLAGEIYISIDRVKDNAAKYSRPKTRTPKSNKLLPELPVWDLPPNKTKGGELYRVIFHGVLHLLGYKDKTKSQQTDMRKAEDLWLKKYAKFVSI